MRKSSVSGGGGPYFGCNPVIACSENPDKQGILTVLWAHRISIWQSSSDHYRIDSYSVLALISCFW